MAMNSDSTQRHHAHWRSTLTVTAACVAAWWRAVPFAAAQEAEAPALVATLALSTIEPKSAPSGIRERLAQRVLRPTGRADWTITVPRRALTDNEAWRKFESEYRPEQRSSSPIKRPIETAKYNLDASVFAVDRFVKSIRRHAQLSFDQGRLQRPRANSHDGFLDNPRVKLDVDLTHGKPYIGARLVIPFGN